MVESYRTNNDALRVFLFGSAGFMSRVMPDLLDKEHNIVGLCTDERTPIGRTLRKWAGRAARSIGVSKKDEFLFRSPFQGYPPPRRLAQKNGIPVFGVSLLRSEVFAAALQQLEVDVILVAGFPKLLPETVFRAPRLACINLHPSLLPKHRGGTPARWVVRLGEAESGITAHLVEETFDSGDVVGQKSFLLEPDWTAGDVEEACAGLAAQLALEILAEIRDGKLLPQKQVDEAASYDPPFKGHFRAIKWSGPGEEVERICLAMRPSSGAMTSYRGRAICFWDAKPIETLATGRPGEVLAVDRKGGVVVACGDGAVCVHKFLRQRRLRNAALELTRLGIGVGDLFDSHQND